GSLCIIDFVPRTLDSAQLKGLKTLAHQVMLLLEARLYAERIVHYTKALETAHQQALQASQAKSQFLATISHDIRTPLHGLIGTLELLADSPLTPQQQDYVTTADMTAQVLKSIISDVLDFAKIEADKLELTLVPTSLTQLFTELERILQDAIAQKQLTATITVDPQIPDRLLIDINRLRQVLLNLWSNAIKFTPNGGSIQLSATLQRRIQDSVGVEIRVSDTGIGIATEQQQQIFLPFVQGNAKTDYEGTGLGLAISSRLLKLMGAQLQLQSKLDQGSSFYFGLDCAVAQPPKSLPRPPRAVERSVCILVAEDNPVNQKIIQHLLEKQGYDVHLVNNGKEAVEAFLAHPFDLILMDLEMPVMTGEEAIRAIRQHSQVPIIALTAHAFTDARRRLLANGATDYLTKPLRSQTLFEAIAIALEPAP
ncbi:MAG: response regulator, partial [Leptolyngbya sp. SIO4C1]|nr:response regulator [Leptolyngbya sp. SIO4C1]